MIKYLPNTQKVIGNALTAKTKNGFTINFLKRYQGNDTIRTQALKRMKDGSFIEQTCMDYGNGSVATLTTRDNFKKPFFSIVFKQKGEVVERCIQNGDSFVYERAPITDKQGQIIRGHIKCSFDGKKGVCLKGEEKFEIGKNAVEYLIEQTRRLFNSLG